jgi:hypothetical protein
MNPATINYSKEGLYSMKSVKTGFRLLIANMLRVNSIANLFLSCRCSNRSAWPIKAISRAFLLFSPLEKADAQKNQLTRVFQMLSWYYYYF